MPDLKWKNSSVDKNVERNVDKNIDKNVNTTKHRYGL